MHNDHKDSVDASSLQGWLIKKFYQTANGPEYDYEVANRQ